MTEHPGDYALPPVGSPEREQKWSEMVDDLVRLGNTLRLERDRLRERDAAAQTLIGVMRHRLIQHGDEAGGKDFPLYRAYQALSPLADLFGSRGGSDV